MIRRRIICMFTVVVLISSFLSVSGPHEKPARAHCVGSRWRVLEPTASTPTRGTAFELMPSCVMKMKFT